MYSNYIANPMLLEDKLWQKDFSAEDYFKFELCHSISIGSFNTSPTTSNDVLICTHGIRMTVNNMDGKCLINSVNLLHFLLCSKFIVNLA